MFLRAQGRRAPRPSWLVPGSLFIELFGSSAALARAVSLTGPVSLCLDRFCGFDLLDNSSFQALMQVIASGKVIGLSLAMPCETFCRERSAHPDQDRAARLRSPERPWGGRRSLAAGKHASAHGRSYCPSLLLGDQFLHQACFSRGCSKLLPVQSFST